MPLTDSLKCVDCAGPNCPCELGLSDNCVYCSRLRGEAVCRCEWSGTCVLLQGPSSPTSEPPSASLRPERLARVLFSSPLAQQVHELWVNVPRTMVPRLGYPGRFVFIRPSNTDRIFDTPLTVVDTSRRAMRLLFKTAGPKTQALAAVGSEDTVKWRGPYPGGLMGLERLRKALNGGPGQAIVVTRGLGQAVALPLVRHLARANGWPVHMLLDSRGAGEGLVRAQLESVARGRIDPVKCYTQDGEDTLGEVLANAMRQAPGRVLLASCGSDVLHRWVVSVWRRAEAEPHLRPWLMATNNALMTCGEGTCGACTRRLPSGNRFRACKADCPPELIFAGPVSKGRQQR